MRIKYILNLWLQHGVMTGIVLWLSVHGGSQTGNGNMGQQLTGWFM
jgi:hypothetical protein